MLAKCIFLMYILTCVRGETLADNISLHQAIEFGIGKASGEVPKMAEGTPLERVQVVNSGARVQIPPSPLTRYASIWLFYAYPSDVNNSSNSIKTTF